MTLIPVLFRFEHNIKKGLLPWNDLIFAKLSSKCHENLQEKSCIRWVDLHFFICFNDSMSASRDIKIYHNFGLNHQSQSLTILLFVFNLITHPVCSFQWSAPHEELQLPRHIEQSEANREDETTVYVPRQTCCDGRSRQTFTTETQRWMGWCTRSWTLSQFRKTRSETDEVASAVPLSSFSIFFTPCAHYWEAFLFWFCWFR